MRLRSSRFPEFRGQPRIRPIHLNRKRPVWPAVQLCRVCVLRRAGTNHHYIRGRKIYDEASLQTGNATRSERRFRACSKHRNFASHNTEDLPGSDANTIGATEPVFDVAVEYGPDAVLEPNPIVLYDAVCAEFGYSRPIDRFTFDQRAGNKLSADRSKH